MTIQDLISNLNSLDSINFSKEIDKEYLLTLLKENEIQLPQAHIEFLATNNGVESYGGYFRLFGVNNDSFCDLLKWNKEDLWKFAWCGLLDDYFCFGETAWGDQYAYKIEELESANPKVYFIEGITMTEEVIANNFEDFLEKEFYLNSSSPYDEILVEVSQRVGELKLNEHITYIPSPLIGGEESAQNVQKMELLTAMVFNGDLCCQLADESQSKQIKEIQPFVDNEGRNRLKVIWN